MGNPGGLREGEAGREELWRLAAKREGRVKCVEEGGVRGRVNLASISRRLNSEAMSGWWVGEEGADLQTQGDETADYTHTQIRSILQGRRLLTTHTLRSGLYYRGGDC